VFAALSFGFQKAEKEEKSGKIERNEEKRQKKTKMCTSLILAVRNSPHLRNTRPFHGVPASTTTQKHSIIILKQHV